MSACALVRLCMRGGERRGREEGNGSNRVGLQFQAGTECATEVEAGVIVWIGG
jgi:hypothetical protein